MLFEHYIIIFGSVVKWISHAPPKLIVSYGMHEKLCKMLKILHKSLILMAIMQYNTKARKVGTLIATQSQKFMHQIGT